MKLVDIANQRINELEGSIEMYQGMLEKTEQEKFDEQRKNKELQQKIDKALKYMNNYIKVEPNEYSTTSAVKTEFEEILKLLKGEE